MGFVAGTAVTTDADLTKYFHEQQLTKILRDGATFDALHVGVVTEHINWLQARRGVGDASTVTNSDDHKPLLVAMVLYKVFLGRRGPAALQAAEKYQAEVYRLRRELHIQQGTTHTNARGIPRLVQRGSGFRMASPGVAPGSQVGRGALLDGGFDNVVQEGW